MGGRTREVAREGDQMPDNPSLPLTPGLSGE